MRYGNVLPTKDFVYKALSLTNLLLTKGGGNGGTQGSVNIINISSGTFTKETLIKV